MKEEKIRVERELERQAEEKKKKKYRKTEILR